jgi:type III pantothenate kinase
MVLLLDIGNTHTHLGLANEQAVVKGADIPTVAWRDGSAAPKLCRFVNRASLEGAAICSVVPGATPRAKRTLERVWGVLWLELTPRTARRVIGIRYGQPATIGPDRLAKAIAARHHYGAPCIAIGFGTAVTFDVVDRAGDFIGGVIAPGLGLMTGCLHERTALLPETKARPIEKFIGGSTREAMRSGCWHGFRGLVREVVRGLKKELGAQRVPIVATGGYAVLVAPGIPEITAVHPSLVLEGLRLAWVAGSKRDRGDLRP